MGAVLIDIDYQQTAKAFEALGVSNFDQQFSQINASKLFEALEMGKISNDDFYAAMQAQMAGPADTTAIQHAWNAILKDFRMESMRFLEKIKSDYRLFLLSNTNAIHLEEVNAILRRQIGATEVDDYFEKAYYSHKVGMRKPNADIFEYVLADANIVAAETLFVDDTQMNIDTAHRLGFKTHLLLPNQQIESLRYD